MKKIIGLSVFVLSLALYSCQSEDAKVPVEQGLTEKSAQITLTEVEVEAASNEVEYEVEFYANAEETLTRWWKVGKAWRWSNKLRYRINHCPDVSITHDGEEEYPKTIVLNYGDGTELKNGKLLSGMITINISAPQKSKDYTRLVTYSDFGVDTILINGTSQVIVDKNDEMFRTFESDLTLNNGDGVTIERTSNRLWQWVEGFDTTEDQSDDVMHITGVVNAEHSVHGTYEKKIVEPLVRIRDCRFIVQGIVEITLNSAEEPAWSMDYGDGECDNIAVVTKDGETYEVDLSKKKMHKKGDKKRNQNGKD
jgi:hypothetical protein